MGACQSSDAVQTTAKPEASKGATTDNAKLAEKAAATEKGSHASSADYNAQHTVTTKDGVTSDDADADSVGSFGSSGSRHSYREGYSSGGSTRGERSTDGSTATDGKERASSGNPKTLGHSSSVIGLDDMIESRKEEGDLKSNVVHIEVPFGKPIEEVYDGIHNGPVLGSGISGLVRLVTHKATGVKYAVKCLDLGLVDSAEGLQQLREEIFIMCQLDHPNIVRLEEVYESHSEIYLVQELCLGGELFDRLDEQPDYHYTEGECARLVKQMLNAVRYLHLKGIIHRDLKLENFLFSSTAADSELKMIDFGLSKHFKFGEVHHEAVGTPYTVAPEVIRGSYDERCDIWAIGVITFLLLSGDPPFGGCGGPEPLMTVRKNILQGSFFFEPEEIWSIVSSQAREFIKTLLVVDPQKRPTAKVAQKHPWLTEWAEKDLNEDDKRLNPNVVKALVTFKEFSDMRKLLCEVLSFTLLPDQIKDLRREFEKMDTDGSGEISLTALKEVLISEAGAGSLGSLTEEEVEDIFNAMRVRKSETRIHWHEFIAAGLSQCQVDERNLRLAFDRLDSDHKGYITFENVMDLMGNDGTEESEEAMRRMWGDSMDACNCSHARITYENFLLLMKGQTKETAESEHVMPPPPLTGAPLSQKGLLPVVHEIRSEEGITTDEDEPRKGDTIVLPSGDVVRKKDGSIVQAKPSVKIATPTTPQYTRNELTPQMEAEDLDSPLSMDEDEDMHVGSPTFGGSPFRQNLTPPQSPTRGPSDYITPRANAKPATVVEIGEAIKLPEMDSSPYIRRRSRSVDDRDEEERLRDELDSELTPKFEADARRALLLPEHEQERSKKEIDQIIKDDSRTNLVVNRALYRAHRQMRLSVLEASKRFEEEQTRRATEMLIKQGEDDGKETVAPVGAGLVMRHGLREKVTSEAVKKWLYQNEKKQEALVEKANKRGGRGKRTRKKTISDMSGLLSSMKEDSNEKLQGTLAESVPPAGSPGKHSESEGDLDFSVDVTQGGPIRKATVPGQFRKVQDPFSMGGLYGHASMPPSVPEPPSKK